MCVNDWNLTPAIVWADKRRPPDAYIATCQWGVGPAGGNPGLSPHGATHSWQKALPCVHSIKGRCWGSVSAPSVHYRLQASSISWARKCLSSFCSHRQASTLLEGECCLRPTFTFYSATSEEDKRSWPLYSCTQAHIVEYIAEPRRRSASFPDPVQLLPTETPSSSARRLSTFLVAHFSSCIFV